MTKTNTSLKALEARRRRIARGEAQRPSQIDGKSEKTESLWLNPLAESRRPSPTLFGAISS